MIIKLLDELRREEILVMASMEKIDDVFAHWQNIKNPELKKALKSYVRGRMGESAGYCLK